MLLDVIQMLLDQWLRWKRGGKEGTYARHLSLYLPLTAAFDIDLNHTCTEHLRSGLRFEDPPA